MSARVEARRLVPIGRRLMGRNICRAVAEGQIAEHRAQRRSTRSPHTSSARTAARTARTFSIDAGLTFYKLFGVK